MRRVVACLCAALLLPACTGDDKPSPTPSPTSASPVPVATAKPKVTVPTGPAPTTLVTKDLVIGKGASVFPGQVVSVQYVGVLYGSGQEFDSSWESGHPFAFRLGNEDVIRAWDQGILGMRVGGRRMVIAPPEFAYGDEPGHPLAKQTLVFVIDVITTGGGPAQVDGDLQPTD